MRNTLNNHYPSSARTERPIFRVTDLDLFAAPNILSCGDASPGAATIRELFDRRMELVFPNNTILVVGFSILSKAYWGDARFRASWVAEVQFSTDCRVAGNEFMFCKDGLYHLYGSFDFRRVDRFWLARIK